MIEILRELYLGHTARAHQFRLGMVAFDIASIIFFAATTTVRHDTVVVLIDVLIAVVVLADFIARYRIESSLVRFLTSLDTWADIVVICSLLAAAVFENLLFLRALRLLRSYRVLTELSNKFGFINKHIEVITAIASVVIFVFITASVVFVLQVGVNPKITHYLDALYFTVTTLSTTGYGDITLVGPVGQLISILMMLVGISLFVRMLQTIFRPRRVRYACPDCGLQRHELDAVHCKACGRKLAIPDEGSD